MGNDYVVRHGILTAATATYVALSTGSDGSTPGSIKVPQGRHTITRVKATFAIDGVPIVDVGNVAIVKLAGKGLPTGDQEFVVGGVISQEDGTSVGMSKSTRKPYVKHTSISVTAGGEITIYGSYSGTDAGSQAISVELEFSSAQRRPRNYYVRVDSMGQATTTFALVETTAEGGTSTIVTEKNARRIVSVDTVVVHNAAQVETGENYVVKLSGVGMTEQELVAGSVQTGLGGGTITDTEVLLVEPFVDNVDIAITGGNQLNVSAAYLGTDPGTPFIAVGLEVE